MPAAAAKKPRRVPHSKQPRPAPGSKKPRPVPHTHRPPQMTLEQWQLALRRQVAVETPLEIQHVAGDEVFGEYAVFNPATGRTYRCAIRGERPGENYCSCPDYAVNTLGACKHLEALLRRIRRRHARALRKGFQPAFSEIYVRYGAQRAICFAAGTSAPPALRQRARMICDADGGVAPECFAALQRLQTAAGDAGHELRVYDDALTLIAETRDAATRRAALQAKYGDLDAAVWTRLLKHPLLTYQRQGALFAAAAGRSILADDMGLGKTIQAIAAAELLARECALERVLVICPTSLKGQWKQEIERFGARPVEIVEGHTHQRARGLSAPGAFFKIMNYDVIHRDLDAIRRWSPELVILDEAQRIKNW